MKAILVSKPAPIESHPLKIKDIKKPIPRKGQLLIKVLACGICRTDLHVIEGDIHQGNYPITPGHQVVGLIEEKGEESSSFEIGERVGVAWLGHTCEKCSFCQKREENLCLQSQYTGYHLPGGYAQYIVANEDYIYKIPDVFTDEEATPLLCAGIIGYRAYRQSGISKGEKLGLIGFGSSAHIVMQIALYERCEVYVGTRDLKHQALAKRMGAKVVTDGQKPFQKKMDSIIVFAPAGELVPMALKSLLPGGTCILAGIYMSDIPKMSYEKHLFHEKKLKSIEANTRVDGKELLEIAAQIPIRPKIEVYPFEKAQLALTKLKQDAICGSAVLKISE